MSTTPSAERTYSVTYAVPDCPIEFTLARPTEAIYDRFEDMRRASESTARTFLLKSTCRSHTGVELDALFAEYPALKAALALMAIKQAGGYYGIIEGEAKPS